jgi:hypothetical protein
VKDGYDGAEKALEHQQAHNIYSQPFIRNKAFEKIIEAIKNIKTQGQRCKT